MAISYIPDKEDYKYKLRPFKRFVLQNFPFIEADFDALTNYELMAKIIEYLNHVIDNENVVEENVSNLYNAVVEIQNYVNNYFDNLDVQEEIDNKLDEMAEQGTLTEIIAQYLTLAGVLAYDTVALMKSATNLEDGSICHTLGYANKNDGLGNYYKVREIINTDVIDDINIIALTDENLIAEKITENKIMCFNSVSNMKACPNLSNGDIVYTLGYYNANDGGGARYKVRTINISDTIDEMTIISLDDENLIAEFIIDETYPDVRKFGIKETETGDISTKLQSIITYLNEKNVVPYISLINVDTTITIPMSAKIKIERINYTGDSYAVNLSQGIYGNIEIERIYSLTGAGVNINPTGSYSGNGYYKINSIAVQGKAVNFDNDSSIVNSTFEGVQWYSREDDCLVIKPKSGAVVGQTNFKVNNYFAVDHVGITIDTTNGTLTNLDFGYASVEGSKNGVLINIVNNTEGIKGYFRVNEVAATTGNLYVLKIMGDASKIKNQFDLSFDSFPYAKIDVSELTMNVGASRSTPNIKISGKCFNPVGDVIGYTGRVMNNRLCMDYLNAPNPYNLTANVDLNYETSNSNPRISQYFTTNNLAGDITVTLPKSLTPGAICSIVNTTGHTVTIKPYGSTNSLNFTTSAMFTTYINGSGILEIIKLL